MSVEAAQFLCGGCNRERPMEEAHVEPDPIAGGDRPRLFPVPGTWLQMLKCRACAEAGR